MLLNYVLQQIHQVVNTVPTVGDWLVALENVDGGALLDLRLPHEDEDVDDQLGQSARDQALSFFEVVGSKSEESPVLSKLEVRVLA